MDTQEILKKAALLKRNPQLANVIPNSEVITLLNDVLGAFVNLQKAVNDGRLKGDKGDKGDNGKTPVVGEDYPSFDQINGVLNAALTEYGTKYQNLQNELQKAISRASELTNGKDAEITEEMIEEIAELAFSLIEMPDFNALIETRITASPESIRDALELLQGDERLDASAIKGLENFIKTVYVNGGGGIGKNQVFNFIREAIADGTISSGGDMTKAVYDPDDDGIVEQSKRELVAFINKTGSTLNGGIIVYLKTSSASSNYPEAVKANASTETTSSKTIGAVYQDTINDAVGYIVTSGEVDNLDTSAYSIGDRLWLATTDGQITTTRPTPPNHAVFIGTVTRAQNGNGRILYAIQNGYELDELHNVDTTDANTNATIQYQPSTGIWETGVAITVSATAPTDPKLNDIWIDIS
jgi:hypothetical protein